MSDNDTLSISFSRVTPNYREFTVRRIGKYERHFVVSTVELFERRIFVVSDGYLIKPPVSFLRLDARRGTPSESASGRH